jgi:two-component system LytT family response regulator
MRGETLRLLVADDEPLARELVRNYSESLGDLEVVGECADGDELADMLAREQPDVALLDIRMPGVDVFDVLAREAAARNRLPSVIFATAYQTYAVRAFELNAVDYLLKPFTEERFAEAIRRVRSRKQSEAPQTALARVIRDLGPRPDRLLVPDGQRIVPVAIADIAWIKAEGDYARIYTGGKSYLVSRTLKELEARLDAAHFIRIHRSAIVHSAQIREVRVEESGRYRVLLSDGTTLLVSRTRAPGLKRWML